LFGKIFVPDAVYRELVHPTAPPPLRQWAGHRPRWLEIRTVASREDEALRPLGVGERDAIALAMSLHTDLVPIDDRKGTKAALTKGLEVTGTPGILRVAARLGSVNLADSFERLKRTNFRYRQEIVDRLLAEQSGEVSG
jgi:predicted nucleic acid-binding protein